MLRSLPASILLTLLVTSSTALARPPKQAPPPEPEGVPDGAGVGVLEPMPARTVASPHLKAFEAAPDDDDGSVEAPALQDVPPPLYDPPPAFVKGQLAHVGDTDFYVPRHQVWVGSQYFYTTDRLPDGKVHRTHYMGIAPRFSYHRGPLFLSLEFPVAVEVYDYVGDPNNPSADPEGGEFANAGSFASFLWDEPSEYAQVIRYVRYGAKEDPLYVNVSRVAAASLGHGTVLRNYNANMDLNRRYVGAQVDYAHDYGGVEFATSNIIGNDIVGLLAFGRPGAWLMPDNLYTRTASVGMSLVVDRHAPVSLVLDSDGALVSDGVGLPAVELAQAVPVFGVDGEVKVYKGRHIDVKTYGDYSRLLVDGGQGGLSMGALGRFNLGERDGKARHAFRTRAEMQFYGSHYDPGYYDMFYEVQKYQGVLRDEAPQETKLSYVLGREDGRYVGTRLEGSYSLVDRLAVAAAVETNTAGDNSAFVHVELPSPKMMRLMATAAKVNYAGVSELLTPGGSNALLIARSDFRPAPWLMIGAEVSKLYRLTATDGQARPAEGQAGTYGSGLWWAFDVSVGYEF